MITALRNCQHITSIPTAGFSTMPTWSLIQAATVELDSRNYEGKPAAQSRGTNSD